MRHVKRWERPDCYIGATWEDYFSSGFGQSRDSDALERANFQTACKELAKLRHEGLDDSGEGWIVVRESHWAVGWVEWIAIHESCANLLACASHLCDRCDDYPVLNDELYSEIEDGECEEVWRNCYNPRERLEYLRKHGGATAGFRELRAAVAGDWYAASNILPCPSDLLY